MVVSGVVTYWPSLELLQRLVDVLVTSTDRVLIFANYPMAMGERRQLTALGVGDCIEIFQSDENVGLGRAYNYLLERARSLGADAVFICDQDSVPHAETVSQLTQKFGALSAAGHQVAVVGSRPIGPRKQSTEFKDVRLFRRSREDGSPRVVAADFVISSGSLVALDAFDAVGPFREDFFIDGLDIEWCFRAWHRGYSCWVALDAPMEHRLGRGVLTVPLLRLSVPEQPPSRLYTYVRNQVHMLGMIHVPLRWKLRMLPYIGLQTMIYAMNGRYRRHALVAIGRGFRDGVRLMRTVGRDSAKVDDTIAVSLPRTQNDAKQRE